MIFSAYMYSNITARNTCITDSHNYKVTLFIHAASINILLFNSFKMLAVCNS
jgi:hypothetical protein